MRESYRSLSGYGYAKAAVPVELNQDRAPVAGAADDPIMRAARHRCNASASRPVQSVPVHVTNE